MKRLLSFLLILLPFAGLASPVQSQDDPPIEIIIIPGGGEGGGPRTPIDIPIRGFLSEDGIYLVFSDDLGFIYVTVEDSSSGIIINTFVDSSELCAMIPFPKEPGDYYISFTLSSSVDYFGHFSL